MKQLDLSKSVYELGTEYPEIIEIMDSLGFSEIKKQPIFNTVGRMMTIPRGCKMRGIPVEKVIFALMEHGFELVGDMPSSVSGSDHAEDTPAGTNTASSAESTAAENAATAKTEEDPEAAQNRIDQIKGYLRRLNAGDALGAVRADFARSFKEVSSAEIMKAEQALMEEGMPLEEVQKLCDVHSALFHGATKAEMDAATLAPAGSVGHSSSHIAHHPHADAKNRLEEFAAIEGHPLQTFVRENKALEQLLQDAKEKEAFNEDLGAVVETIREISIHYAKKGDLLYPHLKVKYDITGPSQVMWTVDDEIRDALSALCRKKEHDGKWTNRAMEVLGRAEEMIYKETNILFPICIENFVEDEWKQIYHDAKDYPVCLGVTPGIWESAEQSAASVSTEQNTASGSSDVSGSARHANPSDEIIMAGGHMTIGQLTAMLNTIPLEISFVDDQNINRYFNEGPKVFKRAAMAIDREVFSCHPPKIEPMVRAILDDFRNNKKDVVPIWMIKNGRSTLVQYMAVRGYDGEYLGTLEIVQDMEFAKEHFAKS